MKKLKCLSGVLFLILGFATGCVTTRFVPDDDFLYAGTRFSSIDSIDQHVIKTAGKKMLVRTNTKLLGIPYKLIVYNVTSGKQKGELRKVTGKLAEPPVLLSQIDTFAMASRLRQHLFASGYFKPEIYTSLEKSGKTVKLRYRIHGGKRYKIGEVIYPNDSTNLMTAIRTASDSSLLHSGDFIQLHVLAQERERINEKLKNLGYFLFNPETIAYRADTLNKGHNNLHLYLKGAAEKSMSIWQIGKIVIHNSDAIAPDSLRNSITLDQNANFHDRKSKVAGYKMRLYQDALLLKQDDLYSKKKHFLSIQRLINLETFQFVKFTFVQNPGDSVNVLTPHLYVTPLKRYHLKFEVSAGAKGNNYLGSKLSSSLINTNLFGGAEKLQLELQGGADVQFGGNRLGANSFNFGGKLSLALPRLLPRFRIEGGLNPTLPETKITLGSTFVQIPKLFSVNVSGLSLDYKFRSNHKAEHNLTPLEISTFGLNSSSALFDSVLVLVPSLGQTFRSQLVLGSSYRLWIDKPAAASAKLHGGAGLKIKSSGNLLGMIVNNRNHRQGDRKLFGLPISQFVKLEGELRGYLKVNPDNTLALRTMLGVGIAYGNSVTLPYSEQFFIGGSNSLRAFRAGTIGPGSYHSTEKVLSNIEYGDFKFEMNGEWRHALNPTVKLAAFVDAGNIWLRKEDPAKPGAGLHNVLSELAIGGGGGLRFDFSLLILRFDLAFPFRKPWYEKGERWVFNEFDFWDRSWRKQNLVLNIGVGYPF